MPDVIFIAEVKTTSPFGWSSSYDHDFLLDLAMDHGDWVAAHTSPRWGGSMEHLGQVRRTMRLRGCDKPLLAKGIHSTDGDLRVALSCADYALVVGRWPRTLDRDLLSRVIFEPIHPEQVALAVGAFRREGLQPRIMLNARDLTTGLRSGPFRMTPTEFRERYQSDDPWVVQASFIRSDDDLDPGAQACIVGSSLVEFLESRGLGLAEVVE